MTAGDGRMQERALSVRDVEKGLGTRDWGLRTEYAASVPFDYADKLIL